MKTVRPPRASLLALPLVLASACSASVELAGSYPDGPGLQRAEPALALAFASPGEAAGQSPVETPEAERPDDQITPITEPLEPSSALHPEPLEIRRPTRTGQLENREMEEISGMTRALDTPGVLFAINDGGNPATLFALSETGKTLQQWHVDARNRDWEDMASVRLNGKSYLVIGDTGDNRRTHRKSRLYFMEEPALDTPATTILKPARTVFFQYEDGPRNVEAFGIIDDTVYLISKEPVTSDGTQPSKLYELTIPPVDTGELLVAAYLRTLPSVGTDLETRLAAALASVDLNNATALDFDPGSNTAYVLTYRNVYRVTRENGQNWADAFASRWTLVHRHGLKQAEALAVQPGQSLWITSENGLAPLWALPIEPSG